MDEILKFYHVKSRELPEYMKDRNEQLEYLLRPYGIMRRKVSLQKGWYRDAVGAMLGMRKDDGSIIALIPKGISSYHFYDKKTGKWSMITGRNESMLEEEAIGFYKPFPLKKIGMGEVIKYIFQSLSMADFVLLAIVTLTITLVGLLAPKLNQIVFSKIITSENMQLWSAMLIFMICISISTMLFESIQNLLKARINTKIEVSVEAATMMRILSLPADFFKKYSSGELFSRSQYMNVLCEMLISTVLSTGLTSVFSLVYLAQIFIYAPALVIPAIVIILTTLVGSIITTFVQMNISRRQMELSAKESGMSYALISGVQKIKLSGAEKRAFARWGNLYAKVAELTYNPATFIKVNAVINTAITLVGGIIMYGLAIKNNITVANYYAFNTAYAMVGGAFKDLF